MSIYNLSMFDIKPKAGERFVIKGENYRITVLTEQLLRLEYSADGVFEDRATRFAFNRAFDTPAFETYREDGLLHIVTKHLHLRYDEKEFSEFGLQIFVDGTGDWRFGAKCVTLGGTVRTLDQVNGACPLGDGLVSRRGFTTFDDSKTIAIGADGWSVPVTNERIDLYFFGYGSEYEKCIKDFYRLSAPVPLLPRYALGNWWSRYYKYTQKEYLELMDTFKAKDIPLSVAVIDMDWHITKTPDAVKYGSGWTGYTWNRELFPSPQEFLNELHARGLHTTLNLHPRDGVRAFEDSYAAFCERLGRKADGKQIEFDASSREFLEGYFDTVLNPLEDEGVDFWWIDWQQKGGTRIEGYDVLWMLNHCHYTDSTRRGERGLLFSRFAEIGSHRYPVGFSGDTHVTWESLDFQPYFTATAANVGYSWWSHDIGGHMGGYHNHELQTRWVQFGVFSPIMRLHSTCNVFNSKEPWKYGECEGVISDFLRLRHRLVPYTYTMMYRGTEEGIPMVRPMYHVHPKAGNAYSVKNQYYFGDLIVAPITSPCDRESSLAKVTAWLPGGTYIDFFNGRVYSGDRKIEIYRDINTMPVFAKAGSIVVLDATAGKNATENPSALELCVFGGDNGEFTLVEDDGKDNVARTKFSFDYGRESTLCFTPASCDDTTVARDYRVKFIAFAKPEKVTQTVNGVTVQLPFEYDELRRTVTVFVGTVNAGDKVTVTVVGDGKLPENEINNTVFELLAKAQCRYEEKNMLYTLATKNVPLGAKIADIISRGANHCLTGAIIELLSAF